MVNTYIDDKVLGKIFVRSNVRAKSYIFRYKEGAIYVTIPKCGSLKELLILLEQNRDNLAQRVKNYKGNIGSSDFSVEEQKILIENAKTYLPSRLHELSLIHKLPYKRVSVKNMRSRWGSCGMQKQISLAFGLMRLPEHLIDYVLLHELCHTVEMNHSERFWNLLDKCCGCSSRELRKELRQYDLY